MNLYICLYTYSSVFFCVKEILKTIGTSSTSTSTSTTVDYIPTSTINPMSFGKDPIDLAALSLLLSEKNPSNFSFEFLQGQNHKSLFSDDDTRKNNGNQLSSFILTIQFSIISILYLIF